MICGIVSYEGDLDHCVEAQIHVFVLGVSAFVVKMQLGDHLT